MNYINNNGSIIEGVDLRILELAEALIHFSFDHSGRKMPLVDVQGVGEQLIEISTLTQKDFCIGNCGKEAFYLFFSSAPVQ